jgi:hypothetical protein
MDGIKIRDWWRVGCCATCNLGGSVLHTGPGSIEGFEARLSLYFRRAASCDSDVLDGVCAVPGAEPS